MKLINRIGSALWKAIFVVLMVFTLLLLPLFLLIKPFLTLKRSRWLIFLVYSLWARITLRTTGSQMKFEGRELIPKDQNLCFIGNHQGYFDIPALMGYLKRPVGFIAKQELFKVPVLSQWMQLIPCIFIDQKTPRLTITSFQRSAEIIKQGFPIAIFPEGSRSRSDEMGDFHLGSLKLPTMANATIVPFVIKGTWRIYEIDGHIHPAKVKVRILPPVSPDNPLYHDKKALLDFLHGQIKANLAEM